jgi:hypothetical protein
MLRIFTKARAKVVEIHDKWLFQESWRMIMRICVNGYTEIVVTHSKEIFGTSSHDADLDLVAHCWTQLLTGEQDCCSIL